MHRQGSSAEPRLENRSRSWTGIRVHLQTTPPGVVQVVGAPYHLLRLHVGAPVRGFCKAESFVVKRGDINLFPARVSDSWQECDASRFLAVELSPSLLRRAAQDTGRDPDRVGLEQRHHFRDAQIEHIAWALDAERKAGYPSGSIYTESLGVALAARLLGQSGTFAEFRGGLTKVQLRRVTAYVDAHLGRDLSLTELATVAGVSVSHLKASFSRSVGMPVHQYVIRRRVEHAKDLLEQGRLPIIQVAAETGFAHQSHLARWFRRLLGVTPSALARSAMRDRTDEVG